MEFIIISKEEIQEIRDAQNRIMNELGGFQTKVMFIEKKLGLSPEIAEEEMKDVSEIKTKLDEYAGIIESHEGRITDLEKSTVKDTMEGDTK